MFKYLDVVTVLFRDEVHTTESKNISLQEKKEGLKKRVHLTPQITSIFLKEKSKGQK
jgi:hypothetical protein